MKRVKLCIWIFATLIILSVGSLFFINSKCNDIERQLQIIYHYHQNDEKEKVTEEIDNLNTMWKKDYKILRCIFRHDKILDLNSSIARLKSYAADANDELGGELRSALFYLDMLENSEIPYLYNIL